MTAPDTLSLPDQFHQVLDQVTITEDLSAATVGHREIEADSPRELQRLLSAALYDVLHAGMDAEPGSLPFHIRSPEFERQLADAVPHRVAQAPGVVCVAPEAERRVVLVQREGVRVWTARDKVLTPGTLTEGQHVMVSAAAARPALSPGFFLVDGSLPTLRRGPVLRVYVHLADPDLAVEVWRTALQLLEDRQAHYRAKVLSTKLLYPRRDALVVYLRDGSWDLAGALAESLGGLPGLGEGVSLFARPLAKGIAAAWEPSDQRAGMRGLSFGQHRAGVLAKALIDHGKGAGPLHEKITERFTEARIALDDMASNADSPAGIV
ncbi:T3SS effector HopA1 family protein [Streptomyces sp. NPDC048196]|uniref:T3SS effector HopA1 family protein n=1 Tax=Streptomyces sp. NPDC048196 TaxID=3154712 RepID=UPI0033D0F368